MSTQEVRATVFVVDDDESVRSSLQRLLRAAGWNVEAFASAKDFLSRLPFHGVVCLLLDVRMPQMSGPELQAHLREQGQLLPIVFLSAHADVLCSVRAMKMGAIDFLLKPVDEEVLLPAIRQALSWHESHGHQMWAVEDRDARLLRLTAREREVMEHVVRGRMNRQIAFDLGIAEKTVKAHRSQVMEKLQVRSVAELVRLSALQVRDVRTTLRGAA